MSDLTENIQQVQARIAEAARRAERDPDEVILVAVSKTHPLETIIETYQAGLQHFGENRVSEGMEKVAAMADWLDSHDHPDALPQWHFVGHVQSRKAGDILGRYALFHALDSVKLAERLQRLAEREDAPPVAALIQCNVSGEASKYGFDLNNWRDTPAELENFLAEVDQIAALDKIRVRGLMTLAPFYDEPERTRPTFQSLAALRDRLQAERPNIDWHHLSMGMTNDYEIAIEEGATIIRVGRALFGERAY